MKFKYIASDPEGRVTNGVLEAAGPADVLDWMTENGLRPVSIKALGGGEKKVFGIFSEEVNIRDKVFLTKYLSLMLRVGTDLFKAIDLLIADFDKPAVKAILIEVKDALTKGQPFYSTFTKYPRYFNSVFVNLIKAGEASGNLENVFENLSKSLEREEALRSKVTGALIYPSILIGLAFLIVFLLTAFALPKLSEVFTSGGIQPPLFSRIVFGIGLFLNKYLLIIAPLMLGGFLWLWFFLSKTILGRKYLSRIVNRIPMVSQVVHTIAIQRFASTLSILLKSGIPIIEAIEITADAVGSDEMKDSLLRVSRDGIAKGLTVGEAFQREVYFPRVVVNLIAISEKAGHIDTILETLANFYESEIDSSIKILLSLLEPVLLVCIGGIVAIIALSIIIPIYQITAQV